MLFSESGFPMNKYIILGILLLSLYQVNGQNNSSKFSISANFGAYIPVGKFGSKNIQDSISAYAKTGIGGVIGFEYKIRSRLSLILQLAGQQNATNNGALSNDAMNFAGDTILFAYNIDKWKMIKITAGASYDFPLNQSGKLLFSTKILAGVMSAWVPEIAVESAKFNLATASITQITYSQYTDKEFHVTFAGSAGIGLKYFIRPTFFVQSNLDFSLAAAKMPVNYRSDRLPVLSVFAFGTSTPGNIPIVFQKETYYRQPLNTVNLTAGIGIKL